MLYAVVREPLATFCAETARYRDADGLPRFVDDESIVRSNDTSAAGRVVTACPTSRVAASP
jgi:hypothetical protein